MFWRNLQDFYITDLDIGGRVGVVVGWGVGGWGAETTKSNHKGEKGQSFTFLRKDHILASVWSSSFGPNTSHAELKGLPDLLSKLHISKLNMIHATAHGCIWCKNWLPIIFLGLCLKMITCCIPIMPCCMGCPIMPCGIGCPIMPCCCCTMGGIPPLPNIGCWGMYIPPAHTHIHTRLQASQKYVRLRKWGCKTSPVNTNMESAVM